jgi:hypothetical protein
MSLLCITPLELHDYNLPSKLVGLYKVQASIDVVVIQASCLGFIIFQSTCTSVILALMSQLVKPLVLSLMLSLVNLLSYP